MCERYSPSDLKGLGCLVKSILNCFAVISCSAIIWNSPKWWEFQRHGWVRIFRASKPLLNGYGFLDSFPFSFQTHKIERLTPVGNHSGYHMLRSPVSILVILFTIGLSQAPISPKNNWKWKQTFVKSFSPAMCQPWENALLKKKAELTYNCCLYPSCSWHYTL